MYYELFPVFSVCPRAHTQSVLFFASSASLSSSKMFWLYFVFFFFLICKFLVFCRATMAAPSECRDREHMNRSLPMKNRNNCFFSIHNFNYHYYVRAMFCLFSDSGLFSFAPCISARAASILLFCFLLILSLLLCDIICSDFFFLFCTRCSLSRLIDRVQVRAATQRVCKQKDDGKTNTLKRNNRFP